MKNSIFFFVLVLLVSCNPLRHIKKAEAFIGNIPPIQIVSHGPNLDPMANDPMRYHQYFMQAVADALNERGISTTIIGPRASTSIQKPTQLSIEIGMAHIEDMRIQPEALASEDGEVVESDVIRITLMGGFGSVDKKGSSVLKNTNIEIELNSTGIANLIKNDPTADPLKEIINMGAEKFAETISPLVAKHIRENK